MPPSFLPLIEVSDNFKLAGLPPRDTPVSFCLSLNPRSAVGLIFPDVVNALQVDNRHNKSEGRKLSWVFSKTDGTPALNPEDEIKSVCFAEHFTTPEARTIVLRDLCHRWRVDGTFPSVLGGNLWRDELYPAYKNPFGPHDQSEAGRLNKAFDLERSASPLFGLVQSGVHLNIYHPRVRGTDGEVVEELKMWVPTRSKSKQKWPGMLDNTIGGGITSGLSPFESIIKESMEEGSISEEVVRQYVKSVGAITNFFRNPQGYLQPRVHYVYELAVPTRLTPDEREKFTPKPLDGEVEAFELLPLSEVISRMHAGRFMPSGTLVNIDFLIRHGYITAESEPHYLEILTRIHGRFEYDCW